MRVDAVARMMQDQMFPESSTESPAKKTQSGTSEKEGINARGQRVNIKTTTMSWADMAARATAGHNTSIKGV